MIGLAAGDLYVVGAAPAAAESPGGNACFDSDGTGSLGRSSPDLIRFRIAFATCL